MENDLFRIAAGGAAERSGKGCSGRGEERMQGRRQRLGRAGEAWAAAYLEREGYEIVARNYRARRGEIDLIARRGDLLVFVEVKTRSSGAFGSGGESVGRAKQARIARVAAHYLGRLPPFDWDVRFDVISIQISEGGVRISHIPDAFTTPEEVFD